METAPPERQAALRQTVGSAVDLGAALTQRLLAFARRQQLVPQVVDLDGLIEGMADLVGFALADGVELEVRPSGLGLAVRVDAGQLESAVLNLCLNAGQAIAGAGRIVVSIGRVGDLAEVVVTDTGRGMSAEVLRHAMEPFFSARGDGTGTGLGLAMVYGFIRQSGGDMRLSSVEGAGTEVRLVLPLAGVEAALPWRRVLVVEDDPVQMAAAVVVLAGAEVVQCGTVEEAMVALQAGRFDLVVSDLSLKGVLGGWQVAEAALAAGMACVVVSGRLPAVNPLAGRLVMMEKPLTRAGLLAAVAGGEGGV